jgi:hypothetical protein
MLGAGRVFCDRVREVRASKLSNNERNHMAISFTSVVCPTMATATLPARRPSAGAL